MASAKSGGVAGEGRERDHVRWLGFALLALTLLVYLPALSAGFIWDDDTYLTENPWLQGLDGLLHLWIPGNTPQYYPAVFTTFWVEHLLWGLEPFGYHAVNVLLHALNALLVWRLCRRLAVPGAWFVAAVFALHPVHVESVAWVTERKNVLSGAFYLAAALAYLRFDEAGTRRGRAYVLSFSLFTLALLSKTVTCSLPAALLLMMLWQRKTLTLRRLAPLAPFFGLGLALALHTAHLERVHVGAEGQDFAFSFAERLQIATRALLFYPWKLLVPWPLVFFYPRWELGADSLLAWTPLACVALVGAAAGAAYRAGRRGPGLALAFYAGTIFPALGFFNVYPMRYSFVADHFQYLASLGLVAGVVGWIATRWPSRESVRILGLALLAVLATLTWRQGALYVDAETLWRGTIRDNPGAWMARSNLAQLLTDGGQNEEALAQLEQALALEPAPRAAEQIRLNLALTLGKLGRHAEALEHFRALQDSSGGMEVRLAMTLERLGRDAEAEELFRAALERPEEERALVPFGLHLLRRGRPEEAAGWLARFVALHPEDADALMFHADACAGAGRMEDALRSAERALALVRARGDLRTAELIERRLAQYRGP